MKMSTSQSNGQNGKLVKSKTSTSTPLKDRTNQISNGSRLPPSNQLAQSITLLANYSDEDLEESGNNSDKMKTRLKSMWNNIKYGKYGWTLKVKPTFNLNNKPIWLLGVCYLRADKKQLYLSRQVVLNEKTKQSLEVISLQSSVNDHNVKANLVNENRSSSSSSAHSGSPNSSELDLPHTNDLNVVSSPTSAEVLENFNDDFQSRIWMTYRRGFKKIPGSNFTTDCGWSCMLRSCQSLLAQAFLNHYLHRNWRFTGAKSDKEDMIHRMLIKWFADDNNPVQSPFSIHQLVHQGLALGKLPGEWYGPSSVAYILKNALEAATNESNFVLDSICIYVAQDCTIYLKDLIKLCTRRNQPSKYKSLSALKKDKTNYNSSHYTTVNAAMLSGGHSYLKSRKRLRSSLKSLGSSIDLAAEQFSTGGAPKQKEASDKGSSSAESNITSRNNSANQSIDDVFTNSTAVTSMIDNTKSSSSFNLGAIHLNSHLKEKNLSANSSTSSSSSSSSSSRSSKSTSSSANRHSTGSTLLNELKKSSKKSKWKSVIILIPLRLGGEKFNSIYTNCIKKLFKSPYCIGIIGGRPKHSLYFVGVHDDKLIYLDPHYCQDSVDTSKSNFPLNSYHCSTARKLSINRIDPSCTIGFYCKTEDDLNNLIEFTRKEMLPSNQKINGQQYPIFLFDEVNSVNSNSAFYETLNNNNNTLNSSNRNNKNEQTLGSKPKDRLVKVRHQYMHETGLKEIDSEDFVLL